MIEIKLNGSKMKDRETAHLYIKRKLSLPDYYGMNLDALWDLLSTDTSQKKITIKNPEMIIINLGTYGGSLLDTFREAADENQCLDVDIELKEDNLNEDRTTKLDIRVDNYPKGE
ncbi:MAG: barstar family protein [Synergistota bacterium]|nr:barstar family protein [Synergistota bacterium]